MSNAEATNKNVKIKKFEIKRPIQRDVRGGDKTGPSQEVFGKY